MCNCSKPITYSECQNLKDFARDDRMFIYHISDRLRVAYVPKGVNPNEIAKKRNFFNKNRELEWYNVKEHPCLHENI